MLSNIRVVSIALLHAYVSERLYQVTCICLLNLLESTNLTLDQHGRSQRSISSILHGFVCCSALLASLRKRLILLPRGENWRCATIWQVRLPSPLFGLFIVRGLGLAVFKKASTAVKLISLLRKLPEGKVFWNRKVQHFSAQPIAHKLDYWRIPK